MAGLYNRMVDPNFATPMRGGVSPNAGLGAPGSAGLPRQQEDDFNAAQMAGLLGMLAKQKKPGEEAASAAPGALDAAQPGMTPITNGGNFDMAQAMPGVMPGMQGQLPGSAAFQDSTGVNTGFAMPPSGSGEAFQLGNVGGNGPLMSNFGGGIPAAAPQIPAALPQGILPQGMDFSQMPWQGFNFGFGGGAGA